MKEVGISTWWSTIWYFVMGRKRKCDWRASEWAPSHKTLKTPAFSGLAESCEMIEVNDSVLKPNI